MVASSQLSISHFFFDVFSSLLLLLPSCIVLLILLLFLWLILLLCLKEKRTLLRKTNTISDKIDPVIRHVITIDASILIVVALIATYIFAIVVHALIVN